MPFFFESIFPVFFFLLFSAFFVMFFFVLGKSIRESVKNNRSPRLTVEARVVVASIDTYLKYAEAVGQVSTVSRPVVEPTTHELAAETVAVVAVELKLIGELHEVYGRPVPGDLGERAVALVQSWAGQRGVSPSGIGIATILGTSARRDLQTSLLRRFGRNLTSLGPMLTGAAVAGYLNRLATRKLGEKIQRDLRKKSR